MKKVLSSQSRLEQIVSDILIDMETRPRLLDRRGNAMLVCASIYQACKVFELLSKTDLAGKCAIVTSYQPSAADIKGEDSGDGMNAELRKYDVYRKMLAEFFGEPGNGRQHGDHGGASILSEMATREFTARPRLEIALKSKCLLSFCKGVRRFDSPRLIGRCSRDASFVVFRQAGGKILCDTGVYTIGVIDASQTVYSV